MNAAQEGESDDNPIRLQGDTADEFRALLWALYALYVPRSLVLAGNLLICVLRVYQTSRTHDRHDR